MYKGTCGHRTCWYVLVRSTSSWNTTLFTWIYRKNSRCGGILCWSPQRVSGAPEKTWCCSALPRKTRIVSRSQCFYCCRFKYCSRHWSRSRHCSHHFCCHHHSHRRTTVEFDYWDDVSFVEEIVTRCCEIENEVNKKKLGLSRVDREHADKIIYGKGRKPYYVVAHKFNVSIYQRDIEVCCHLPAYA